MTSLPNILIVDDNESNLTLLEAIISKINVNLIKADSGPDALEKARNIDFALAIVDVMMPEMNGYELAVKLNNDRIGDRIPVIFLTAGSINKLDEFEGYDSGAVDFIYRPINIPILKSKIEVFIELFNQKQTIKNEAAQNKKYAEELTRINEALTESEGRLEDIIFNMADWIWEVDKNGIYTYSSYNGIDLLGVSQEDIIGKSPFDFMSPEEGKRCLEIFSELMAKKSPIRDFQNWRILKFGRKI